MATLVLKQIERGSVTTSTTDVTNTVTLTTTLTDTAKTVLIFSAKCASNGSINFNILGRVLSTTQIQFERAATPAVACTIEYQVIEFISGISVQHLYFQQATATTATTISTVTLANTFAMISHKGAGSGWGGDDLFYADLTTTTNLNTVGTATQASAQLAVQVIQIDNASVQKVSTTLSTSSATTDVTVTTIDPAKTFWVFSQSTSVTQNAEQNSYLSYVNSTTLRYTRALAAGAGSSMLAYVVSLSSGVSVQNITTTISASSNTVSPTISSVTVADTALLANGIYQRFASASLADDDAGYVAFALASLNTTSFTATRASSPATAATINVQVLEFNGGLSDISDSLLQKRKQSMAMLAR